MLKRFSVNKENEKTIIFGILTNTDILLEIYPLIDERFFSRPMDYLVKWTKEYFDKYREAPGKEISTIISSKSNEISKEDLEIISNVVTDISDVEINNIPLIKDIARDFCQKRDLELFFEDGKKLIALGAFSEAEEAIRNHGKTERTYLESFSISSPFSYDEINSFFEEEERQDHILFKPDGALGRVIGRLEREEFISISAVEKAGKSYLLDELGIQAAENGCNVVIFSHEMSERQRKRRLYKRISGCSFNESKNVKYPVFDCLKNQEGSCTKIQRVNDIGLLDNRGNKPPFQRNMVYKPCIACRGTNDFKPDYWFSYGEISQYNPRIVCDNAKAFQSLFGDRIRLKAFPEYTATMDDIERYLEILANKGFFADVVVDDYLDIHHIREGDRFEIEKSWRIARRISGEMKLLYITAEQAKSTARLKRSIKVEDSWSDTKAKTAHLTGRYGISVTEDELVDDVKRVSSLLGRDRANKKFQAMLLGCTEIGHICLDSEIVWW